MHETALVKDLVREIDRLARHYGGSRVARAHVRLGLLAPVSEEALRDQFSHAAGGTLAEGAELVIVRDTDLESTASLGVLLKRVDLSPAPAHVLRVLPEPEHLIAARFRAKDKDGAPRPAVVPLPEHETLS